MTATAQAFETRRPVQFVPMTISRKVSGGEVFIKIGADGRTRYWLNAREIDRATARRKLGY